MSVEVNLNLLSNIGNDIGGKKKLSAKKYLGQLETIDTMIKQDLLRLEEIKTGVMCAGGIDYAKDRVQTSMVSDKLGNAVAQYTELNEQINREIDSFIDAQQQIIREIRELRENRFVDLLYRIYVRYQSVSTAAYEVGITKVHCSRIHNAGLKLFEEIHGNLQYFSVK